MQNSRASSCNQVANVRFDATYTHAPQIEEGGCRGLVSRRPLYHVISQYKTNLVLSLKDSVADLENVVQLWGHSAQQQRLGVKIEGFLSSYCYIDVYLVVY